MSSPALPYDLTAGLMVCGGSGAASAFRLYACPQTGRGDKAEGRANRQSRSGAYGAPRNCLLKHNVGFRSS